MNIMIAAVGIDSGFASGGGGAHQAVFIAASFLAGVALLAAAGRIARRHHQPHAVRYTIPRL